MLGTKLRLQVSHAMQEFLPQVDWGFTAVSHTVKQSMKVPIASLDPAFHDLRGLEAQSR